METKVGINNNNMQINQQENLNYISKIRKALLYALIGTNKLLISLMNQVIPQEASKVESQFKEQQNGFKQKLQEFDQISHIIPIPDLSLSKVSVFVESQVIEKQAKNELDESLQIVCYTKYGKKFHKLSCSSREETVGKMQNMLQEALNVIQNKF
ncbi:hypothetical protein pb186bvf_015449 [Paramecium bursaria]